MSIVLQSSGGGSVTIQEPATASNLTATLPAATGQIMVSGNMPAFSAYNNATQSISTGTWTKLVCNTKKFDTSTPPAFDNTTNYRFQPLVAGYYQVNVSAYCYPSATGIVQSAIYKNGTSYLSNGAPNSSQGPQVGTSSLIYMNGTTDYIEAYQFQNSGGSLTSACQEFSASMVRSA